MIMLVLDLAFFGVIGVTVWAVQMAWIPFWAAGVVNGLGHFWGYRNYACPDASRSEEQTSELQSLMRISYAVFCLKTTTQKQNQSFYSIHTTVHTYNQIHRTSIY